MPDGKPDKRIEKMSAKVYRDFWNAYVEIQRGKSVDTSALAATLGSLKPAAYTSVSGNLLAVFNSGRLADTDLLRSVSMRRHFLAGEDVSASRFIFADVRIDKYAGNRFSLRRATLIWVLKHFPSFVSGLLSGRCLAAGLISVYQTVFRVHEISKLELFSSNSRSIELLRIAAITDGLQITEYLHGICSDIFASYYLLLHSMAADGQISYVNMVPKLPQPAIIRDHLLWHNSLEVFYQNEAPWSPRSEEKRTDVLIVGSAVAGKSYWDTEQFVEDKALIEFCQDNNINVIYCPHPDIYSDVSNHIPYNIQIGRFREHVNSCRVLVGHYSTALFVAHIFGKKIFLFKTALRLLPDYFVSEMFDSANVTLDKASLLEFLATEASDVIVDGAAYRGPGISLQHESKTFVWKSPKATCRSSRADRIEQS